MANRTSCAFRSALFLAFAGAGCNAIIGIGDPRTEAPEAGAEVPNVESGVSPTTDAARVPDSRALLDTAPPLGCYKEDEALALPPGIPPTRHSGKCTPGQITDFKSRCLGSSASSCDAYIDANKDCSRCIFGALRGEDPVMTPVPALLPMSDTTLQLNAVGCAAIVLNRPDCTVKLAQGFVCVSSACVSCKTPPDETICNRMASEGICKSVIDLACENAIKAATAQWQPICQGTNFDETYVKVTNYLCGPG